MELRDDIERVLYSEEDLKKIVSRLGKEIAKDYQGKNLFLVGVLKGSFIFMSDLARAIDAPCTLDFLSVSSYGKGLSTSGEVQVIKDLTCPLEDKDLLIVEDILDSGVTLSFLKKMLSARHPRSIRLCTLLDKPERRRVDIKADYVGSTVEDCFIVGYGFDYKEKYRNLPYIGVLKPEFYEA